MLPLPPWDDQEAALKHVQWVIRCVAEYGFEVHRQERSGNGAWRSKVVYGWLTGPEVNDVIEADMDAVLTGRDQD